MLAFQSTDFSWLVVSVQFKKDLYDCMLLFVIANEFRRKRLHLNGPLYLLKIITAKLAVTIKEMTSSNKQYLVIHITYTIINKQFVLL